MTHSYYSIDWFAVATYQYIPRYAGHALACPILNVPGCKLCVL
jgi:hypothetical protein